MQKVALITGSAKRIGETIARTLHNDGKNVVIHYQHSKEKAKTLTEELNQKRQNSAIALCADISNSTQCRELVDKTYDAFGQLDILINNASSFFKTPIGSVDDRQWDDLLGSNLKGPFFISQAAAPLLQQAQGHIVNIVDIHADRPLKNFTVYCLAKAGLVMLTKSLARELSPHVLVNAVAPGVILWPNQEQELSAEVQTHILERTCLKRQGTPEDIAQTVLFLTKQTYITGQVIAVDGGRSIKD